MPIHKNARMPISLAKRRREILLALAATCIMTWSLSLWAKPNDAVPYPVGYRSWTHVKTALIGPQSPAFAIFGGLYHIYANKKAMEGYRTGRFPDGSVLVFEILETRENAGVTAEGPRKRVGVMVKNSKEYAETGGWGFESFQGDSQTERRLNAEGRTACFKCHEPQKDRDYVLSEFRK
jgi:Cytochrome P460